MTAKILLDIFDKSGFMPHGHCYLWESDVLYTNVISDGFIALSYFLIPFVLIYVTSKRKDIKYRFILILFGLFIVLCGSTHLMGIITVWDPEYRLEGYVKAATAVVSLITAVSLYPMMPKFLKMPSSEQLTQKNIELEKEIALRKEAELRERQSRKYIEYLLATSTSGIFAFDTDFRITEWNPALEKWRSISKESIMGLNIFERFPEIEQTVFAGLIRQVMTGKSTLGIEVPSAISPMWFDVNLVPVYDDQNNTIGGLAILNDITQRKKVEEEILQKNKELKVTNQELQQFAYIASHDLKAPLRGIGTLAHWLIEDYADKLGEKGMHTLKLLKDRVKRMNHLIDGILQYSRIGRITEELEEVDLSKILKELPGLLTIPDNIELKVESKLPVIKAEKNRVNQIFLNLIANSIKYSDSEKGEIRISYEDKGKFHQFSVQDNGCGIAPKDHKRIFKMFQTLQSDEVSDGTGIGLTIVKKIIDYYGGEIWVESEVGKGANFTFTLPKKISNKPGE